MRKRRNFIGYTLILLIIAGLGYIGYSLYYNPDLLGMLGFNTNQTSQGTNNNDSSMPGMNSGASSNGMSGMTGGSMGTSNTSAMMSNSPQIGALALKNKEKLTQFITLLTDAVNQITLDPYSSITTQGSIPGNKNNPPQGTVNIYPNGTSTINVSPDTQKSTATVGAQTTTTTNTPTVMSQSRLQQLHDGIFKLSQGMIAANDLNDNLSTQSSIVESNPIGYQTYLTRYNTLVQNRIQLNNALSLISSASTLVNVNPYGQYDGYAYNPQGMESLHSGIFKLAQAMGLATSLSNDFLNQISNASYDLSNFSAMSNMDMNSGSLFSNLFNLSNLSSTMTWVIIILVVLFSIGLLGTLSALMSPRKKQL